MDLRQRLANLRKERGVSLRQLRELIEDQTGDRIAVSYLSSLERVGGTPSIDVLTKIAAGYGLTIQELLAPIDPGEVDRRVHLPPSLQEFWDRNPELQEQEVVSLSHAEYRGARPESADEWQLIYDMLGAILRPKLGERS